MVLIVAQFRAAYKKLKTMNAQELRKDMELVDSSIHGEVDASWGEGIHFWFGIYQSHDEDKREYTWSYEDGDPYSDYSKSEHYSYKTLDELFSEHDADGFEWDRLSDFPDLVIKK